MKKTERITEMQPDDLRLECSATWGGVRAVTQTVAFRVTGTIEDGHHGWTPVWEASPLTVEEEEILRELRLSN